MNHLPIRLIAQSGVRLGRRPLTSACTQCLSKRPISRMISSPITGLRQSSFPSINHQITSRSFASTSSRRAAAEETILVPKLKPETAAFFESHSRSADTLIAAINKRIIQSSKPTEDEVLAALTAIQTFATRNLGPSRIHVAPAAVAGKSPAAALLSLEDHAAARTTSSTSPAMTANPTTATSQTSTPSSAPDPSAALLASTAYSLLTHPPVFITPAVLSVYISALSSLSQLSTLPAAFALYAKKPLPNGKQPNASHPRYAVPQPLANAGLSAAIAAKDMNLALDIIATTFAAPAFTKAKVLRASVPLGLAAIAGPGVMYMAADILAGFQNEVSHEIASGYAFAGLLVYLTFTASIGIVAVTTANDQMERVTWAMGTPLRLRWTREEERAALDRVAVAWGFKQEHMRGFEEGPEWELLREAISGRGMVLDNPALMEGME